MDVQVTQNCIRPTMFADEMRFCYKDALLTHSSFECKNVIVFLPIR